MPNLQDDRGHDEQASQRAYDEAVKVAYNTLASAVTDYFDEYRSVLKNENFNIPENFRPLRDYERTMRIQKFVLRLALKTAASAEYGVTSDGVDLTGYANDHRSPAAVPTLSG
jgi:hypothetical protein